MHQSNSNPHLHHDSVVSSASGKNLSLAMHAYQGAHHSLNQKNSVGRVDIVRAKSGGGINGPFPEVEKYMS